MAPGRHLIDRATVVSSSTPPIEAMVHSADGTNGLSHEVTAEHLGASVLYGTVAISKTTKAGSAE